jgi:hypothetical protein
VTGGTIGREDGTGKRKGSELSARLIFAVPRPGTTLR